MVESGNENDALVQDKPTTTKDDEQPLEIFGGNHDNENDDVDVDVDPALVALVDPDNSPVSSTNKNGHAQEVEEPNAPLEIVDENSDNFYTKLCKFYTKNSFLILVIVVILLAYAYPPLGKVYLAPQITATWIAVIIIFFLSGVSLKTEEFKNALKRWRFNLFVQVFNFGFVSVLMFGITRALVQLKIIASSLGDGMVIGSCVPITVNMVLVLTKSSKGDEASAIFNAAFGNILGVFISPLLILLYLGQSASIALGTVFYKLCLRVLLPLFIGQLVHSFSPLIVSFVKEHKPIFKKVQEYCLIFIVYTVFCRTFYDQRNYGDQNKNQNDGTEVNRTTATDAIIMIAFQFIILSLVMIIAWMLLKVLYPNQPTLRVMGLFGCSHKSVAVGIPLINAIYEDNKNIGFYTLPLLIWHPMQLVIGSFLSPRLAEFVTTEKESLEKLEMDNGVDDNV